MRFNRATHASRVVIVAVLAIATACSTGDLNASAQPDALADGSAQVGLDDDASGVSFDESAVRSKRETDNSSRAGADSTATAPGAPAPPTLSSDGDAQPTLSAPTLQPAAPAVTAARVTVATTLPVTPSTTSAPSTETTATLDPPSSTVVVDPPVEPVAADPAALVVAEGYSASLLDALRGELVLTSLNRQAEMDQFARDWSRQMAETGSFEHSNGPYGENIAYTTETGLSAAEAADVFHKLWTESPGHYGNMTNNTYVTVGIGLYLTDKGWYGTHVFGF